MVIRERVDLGRPIICPIHVQLGDIPFPGSQWDDYAVVILGWWIEEFQDHLNCESRRAVSFLFMDGPYQVNVSNATGNESLLVGVIRGSQIREVVTAECSPQQIKQELYRATRQLLRAIKQANAWDADCARLERIVSKCDELL
jgi:hypothetical protein